jgi:hypothetical protein
LEGQLQNHPEQVPSKKEICARTMKSHARDIVCATGFNLIEAYSKAITAVAFNITKSRSDIHILKSESETKRSIERLAIVPSTSKNKTQFSVFKFETRSSYSSL